MVLPARPGSSSVIACASKCLPLTAPAFSVRSIRKWCATGQISRPIQDACEPMSEFITIMARDGHEFQAWLAAPAGQPRGAVVVVQEIFGVNSHIRAVADGYAAAGYVAIAPAFFDRVRRRIELGYSGAEVQEGRGYVQQLERPQILADLAAAIAIVKHAGRVGVIGYCWGGTIAYVAACELPLGC